MFAKKNLLWSMALLVALGCTPALAEQAPSPDDLSVYNTAVNQYQQELNNYFNDMFVRAPSGAELRVFEQYFSVKKKSSTVDRAFRQAKEELNAQLRAWTNSIAAQGYKPVEDPAPILKLDPKCGTSGFKFYVRLKLHTKIWAVKVAQRLSAPALLRPGQRPA